MNSSPKNIFVTQPALPPLEEFTAVLERIWDSKLLTNGGPFHQQLEKALCDFLGVQHLALFSSGTTALTTGLQALDLSGEVITTPYSFVATTHCLSWNRLDPVFVDIHPDTLNLDPARIEEAITERTTAILPVHCYGHPCDVEGIRKVAEKHNLRVLYDAAHAFHVRDEKGSVLVHGDLSILSFHATKVFNTFEGGAIVCPDAATKLRIDRLKNFGFVDEVTVTEIGINGKMSEVNAAFGLVQLKHIENALRRRGEVDAMYRRELADTAGIHCVQNSGELHPNFAYFPILVRPGYRLDRDGLYNRLKEHGVFSRRYFYPLISQFPMYRDLPSARAENLPVATMAADQVLCLPIYPDLGSDEQQRIIDIIRSA